MRLPTAPAVAPEASLEVPPPAKYLRLKIALETLLTGHRMAEEPLALQGLTKAARHCTHAVAGRMSWTHESYGQGPGRFLVLRPHSPTTAGHMTGRNPMHWIEPDAKRRRKNAAEPDSDAEDLSTESHSALDSAESDDGNKAEVRLQNIAEVECSDDTDVLLCTQYGFIL